VSPIPAPWLVTLDLGGEVIGACDGAPGGWVGTRLAAETGAPAAVLAAASAAVAEARRTGAMSRAHVDAAEVGAPIDLVAMPALALRRATVSVRALLRRALAPLEVQAHARDVGIELTIDPSVPESLQADPQKLAWAVAAIVGNATRYARSGTRQMPGGSIAVRVRRDEASDDLVLEVEDDGPGIPADLLARLFDRGPGTAGSAVALAVVRDVLEAHGGGLSVASSTADADHGTTVTARLPLH
jgi:signal transduction histidine kinase